MSLSSSTESGCDGPCEAPIEDTEDNTSSTDKMFVDDHSDTACIPVELHTNISNGDLPNSGTENPNPKSMSSNGLDTTLQKEENYTFVLVLFKAASKWPSPCSSVLLLVRQRGNYY